MSYVCLFVFLFWGFSAMCWDLCIWAGSAKKHTPVHQVQAEISTRRRSRSKHNSVMIQGVRLTLWLWCPYIVAKLGRGSRSWLVFALSHVMAPGELPDSLRPRTCKAACVHRIFKMQIERLCTCRIDFKTWNTLIFVSILLHWGLHSILIQWSNLKKNSSIEKDGP